MQEVEQCKEKSPSILLTNFSTLNKKAAESER